MNNSPSLELEEPSTKGGGGSCPLLHDFLLKYVQKKGRKRKKRQKISFISYPLYQNIVRFCKFKKKMEKF